LTAPFLEVLTSTGKYYWIGWERIEKLEFRSPKYLRDLLWRQTEMVIREGPDALVYVPVLYPGSHRSQDPELRLGRRTDWIETPAGPTAGVGQRTLLVGDADKSILSIGRISFSLDRARSTSAE
jgi:type VI secretion system protein ImpE